MGRDRRVNGASQPVFISIERPCLQGVRRGVREQDTCHSCLTSAFGYTHRCYITQHYYFKLHFIDLFCALVCVYVCSCAMACVRRPEDSFRQAALFVPWGPRDHTQTIKLEADSLTHYKPSASLAPRLAFCGAEDGAQCLVYTCQLPSTASQPRLDTFLPLCSHYLFPFLKLFTFCS